MKVLQFIYNDEIIDFSKGENLMINATQMAKVFRKETRFFLETEHAKNYIKALEKFINSENNKAVNTARIIDYRGRNGVYFERRLALKFAAWLDVEFELWVYNTIDAILLGNYKEHKEATIEKIKAKQEFEQLRKEILESDPRFERLSELENQINKASKKQRNVINQAIKQLEFDFYKTSEKPE